MTLTITEEDSHPGEGSCPGEDSYSEQGIHLLEDRLLGAGRSLGVEKGMAQGVGQGMGQEVGQGMGQAVGQGMGQGMAQGVGQGMVQGVGQGIQPGVGRQTFLWLQNRKEVEPASIHCQQLGRTVGRTAGRTVGRTAGRIEGRQPAVILL